MADPDLSSFISSDADLLRGDNIKAHYGAAFLPFMMLRRLDYVPGKTNVVVLAEATGARC